MVDGLSISLDAHTSSMNGIELVFDVIGCPRRSLATTGCLRITISALCY